MKRVGILTSGGDCQGLNATIRAVAKTLYNQLGNDVEIIGIIDGYRGLIYGETRKMKPENFRVFSQWAVRFSAHQDSRLSLCVLLTRTALTRLRL